MRVQGEDKTMKEVLLSLLPLMPDDYEEARDAAATLLAFIVDHNSGEKGNPNYFSGGVYSDGMDNEYRVNVEAV